MKYLNYKVSYESKFKVASFAPEGELDVNTLLPSAAEMKTPSLLLLLSYTRRRREEERHFLRLLKIAHEEEESGEGGPLAAGALI